VVVLEEDETVAGGVVGAGDGDVAAELAGDQALVADAGVEAGDVVVAVGEDELAARGVGGAIGRVLLEQLGAGGVAGVGDVQAAGLLIGVESRRDTAAGKVLGGLALPRLGLAADGLEARRGALLEESSVGVAGTDRLELIGTAEPG
jgi:hypothetical protein